MKTHWILIPVLASLMSVAAWAAPTIELTAGMYRIEAETVSTPEDRSTGLMNRSSMPVNHGMLFVFPEAGIQCFWMKNTLIPLSIAFMDDGGRIVRIAEMKAQSLANHCSGQAVRFALEMNAGWFKKRGLTVGSRISGLDRAPASRY